MAELKKEWDFEHEHQGDILVMRLKGRLDANTSKEVEKQIFDFIQEGKVLLLLDFGAIDYVSSSGMRMLLSTTRKLHTLSGRLILCALTKNVKEILTISGVDHILECSKSEEEGLRLLAGP